MVGGVVWSSTDNKVMFNVKKTVVSADMNMKCTACDFYTVSEHMQYNWH